MHDLRITKEEYAAHSLDLTCILTTKLLGLLIYVVCLPIIVCLLIVLESDKDIQLLIWAPLEVGGDA